MAWSDSQTGLTRYIALGVNYTYYYRSFGQALDVAERACQLRGKSGRARLRERLGAALSAHEETEWYPVRSTRRRTSC